MVKRCIRKDKAAWDVFIQRYQGVVRKAAYYKLYKTSSRAPRNDVDDIVQEVFLALWKDGKLAKLRDVSRLKGWLAVVAINQAATYRRQQHKKEMMTVSLNEQLYEDITTTLEDIIPCNQPDPEQLAETNERVSQLEVEMANLRIKERIALGLKIYDGKAQGGISGIMDIPAGTVASLISRAKIKIQNRLMEKRRFNITLAAR